MTTAMSVILQGSIIDGERRDDGIISSFEDLIELNRTKVDFNEMFAFGTEGDLQGHFDFQVKPEHTETQKMDSHEQ